MASPINPIDLPFNPAPPSVMHIDLNSCFASVEQQANPLLRGKPIVVASCVANYGCVLAPSIEAKLYGIKTGMTVGESRLLCPWLITREADPPKYRHVHRRLAQILEDYSNRVFSKSIDEFALSFKDFPSRAQKLLAVGKEIKSRIRQEIGEWLRVSIGISTNQILAKLASGLNKPDGLDILDHTNFLDIYRRIDLKDLCGINTQNELRLSRVGIRTSEDFYRADIQTLKIAFESVLSRDWYIRLRGWEIDDIQFQRRSYGQSYVLPRAMSEREWFPILAKLIEKGTRRMRLDGYAAKGVHLYLRYHDKTSWHHGEKFSESYFLPRDVYCALLSLYRTLAPRKKVKKIAFSCFALEQNSLQLSLDGSLEKKKNLTLALDTINSKWGEYTTVSARTLGSDDYVRDAIAFGR